MEKVLVTDGNNRAALAIVRSLGKKGYEVIVTQNEQKTISSISKYCKKSYIVTDASINSRDCFDELNKIIKNENIDIVIPTSETTINSINSYRSELSDHVIIASPEHETVEKIFNKYTLFQKAIDLGVDIPATVFVKNKKEFENLKTLPFPFPVVIKPGLSKIPVENGFLSAGVVYANNYDQLKSIYKNEIFNYPSMIQEKIDGPGTGLFTLFDKDHHLALFSHQRVKEKPPSGGVSVICKSVSLDEKMVVQSEKLLSAVGWRGVAMVEFKRDLRDGKAKLMEINGRFWGSLQLAIDSGVDFPLYLVKFLDGDGLINQTTNYLNDNKLVWLLGYLDHMYLIMKDSSVSLKDKLIALKDAIRLFNNKASYDVLSINDIKPFFMEIKQYVKLLLK